MLDKKSRQVLKALNKAKNKMNYIDRSASLLKYLPKEYSLSKLEKVICNLEDLEYVTFYSASGAIFDIHLLYKAENYKELNWIEFKSFLTRSIFLPIGVSAITTLITIGITILLKK